MSSTFLLRHVSGMRHRVRQIIALLCLTVCYLVRDERTGATNQAFAGRLARAVIEKGVVINMR